MTPIAFLLVIAGSLTIAFMNIAQRSALKEKSSPMKFLASGFTLFTGLLITTYVLMWGWNYPPRLLAGFWNAVLVGALANYAIQYIHAKVATYKEGEVSLAAPISAMTPGLITIVAIALKEFPGPRGVAGIICMMLGSWIISFPDKPAHWWGYLQPLYRLRLIMRYKELSHQDKERTKVILLALTSAALGTVGLLCDGLYTRRGSDLQGMWFGIIVLIAILAIGYIIQYFCQSPEIKNGSGSFYEKRFLFGIIIFAVMFVVTQWLIKPLYFEAYIAYVGTLYRLQILFTVILGYWIFHERDIKKRLVAAIIIIIGAVLIASDDLPARISSHIEHFGF
ncbi:MAG: hypothetical protein Q7S34_04335 [bacterium]|nr:hypothetical protein [bacterium]